MKSIILLLIVLAAAPSVLAHSGRTDSSGCHVDHRTGIRHCH